MYVCMYACEYVCIYIVTYINASVYMPQAPKKNVVYLDACDCVRVCVHGMYVFVFWYECVDSGKKKGLKHVRNCCNTVPWNVWYVYVRVSIVCVQHRLY